MPIPSQIVIQEHPLSALINTSLAAVTRVAEAVIDKRDRLATAELNLLVGDLRDARSDLRGLKADYGEKSIIHESIFGANPNNPQYTKEAVDLSGDIMQDYRNTIESKEKEIDFYSIKGKNIVRELAAVDKLKEGSKYISKHYGDEGIYDLPDLANNVLSDQLGIDVELIKRYKENNPWFGSQKWIDLMNLQEEDINWKNEVRSSARKKEALREEEYLKGQVLSMASNTLGTSKFMNEMDSITGSGIDEDEMKRALLLIGGEEVQGDKGIEIRGLRIVDALWGDKALKLDENKKYDKLLDLYRTFKTLKTGTGTPKDKIGINLFIKRWRESRESLPSDFYKDTFDEWSEEFFNVSSKNIDNLYFDEYDPVTGTTKKSFYKNETVKSFLKADREMYNHLSNNDYLQTRGKVIRDLFVADPNITIKKTQDVIDYLHTPDVMDSWYREKKSVPIPPGKTTDVGLSYPYKWDFDAYGGDSDDDLDILWKEHPEWHMDIGKFDGITQYQLMPQHYEEAYELLRSKKKRVKSDILGVRKKLVDAQHPIVEIPGMKSHSGDSLKMALPVAERFLHAKDLLASKGISLDVQDTYRSYDAQKKAYDRWVASGEKGPLIAHPDTSFHTIGYAFDLAQTHDMKQEEVFNILESVGFIQNPGEWWHWSLEKIN